MIGRRACYLAVGAGGSALLTMLLITLDVSVILAAIVLGVQIALGMVGFWVIMTGDGFQPAARPQPAVKPPLQPPATASQPATQPLEEIYIRLANRPQPPTTALDVVVQPPATAPQPPATAPQPEPQPLPFPLANGHYRERQPRAEVPWQPAPWDVLAGDAAVAEGDEDAAEAAGAALLPRRPPTAADYAVIRQALADCSGSRRRACVIVYGSRDGQTYPWLRRVADYWDIAEEDRPSILAWELLGTRDIPGNLAGRLGLEMTAEQVSAAIDAARLTRCAECEAWAVLDELDENDACTMCTA